jgi:hypothetical protein
MNKANQIYNVICATCKVLLQIDWFGNQKIDKICDQDLKYLGEARTLEQYFKRYTEIIKDNILKNVSNINDVEWCIKCYDEHIANHLLYIEVCKILEIFIKKELIKSYPSSEYMINNHIIDHKKSIIVEITNKSKIINISVINVQQFLC